MRAFAVVACMAALLCAVLVTLPWRDVAAEQASLLAQMAVRACVPHTVAVQQ